MTKFILILALIGLLFVSQANSACIHDDLDIQLEEVPTEEVDPDTPHQTRMLAANYGGLRIIADYTHLTGVSSSIKNYIQDRLLPATMNYFRAALQVSRLSKLKITGSSVCGLSVPSKYKSGVEADLVLFITGASTSEGFLAWAKPCQQLSGNKRAFVGQVNFNTRDLIAVDDFEYQQDLYTIMHEVTHVLGFSRSLYDAWGAQIKTKTVNGAQVQYIANQPLRDKVRSHFGCDSAVGAYLENQGGSGSAGSHFERRIYMNEFMTASEFRDARITKFTLALLESTGWYKVDYDMSEPFFWGQGEGCSFMDSTCINRNTNKARSDEFCSDIDSKRCTFTGKNGGYCASNQDSYGDNCPYYRPYSNMDCENNNDEKGAYLAAEDYGTGSRCFDGTLYPNSGLATSRSYCFKYDCEKQSDGDYVVKVILGDTTAKCTSKGQKKVSGFGGYLECPDPNKWCTTVGKKYCKRGCMGKGKCLSSGKCDCDAGWGLSDCSKKL